MLACKTGTKRSDDLLIGGALLGAIIRAKTAYRRKGNKLDIDRNGRRRLRWPVSRTVGMFLAVLHRPQHTSKRGSRCSALLRGTLRSKRDTLCRCANSCRFLEGYERSEPCDLRRRGVLLPSRRTSMVKDERHSGQVRPRFRSSRFAGLETPSLTDAGLEGGGYSGATGSRKLAEKHLSDAEEKPR